MNKTLEKVLAMPTEVYSRVVGYFRPVKSWNKGKQEEFGERKNVTIKDSDKE
jgi:anaerobic ribonucleoside-triphosphate reductase